MRGKARGKDCDVLCCSFVESMMMTMVVVDRVSKF